jgi:hypothetical protein
MRKQEWRLLAWCFIVPALLGLLCYVGYVWLKETRHVEAMQHWPRLVQSKFDAPDEEVANTFLRCFRKGDDAAKYEHLFATAEKKIHLPNNPSEVIVYRWSWRYWTQLYGRQVRENATLAVYVEDGRILMVSIYGEP